MSANSNTQQYRPVVTGNQTIDAGFKQAFDAIYAMQAQIASLIANQSNNNNASP